MKDSIMCCAFCLGLGMVVGGVIVSNNPKVRTWFKSVSTQAKEAYSNVKETIEEKVEEAKKNNCLNQKEKS